MKTRNKHFKAAFMAIAALMLSFGVGCSKDKKGERSQRRGVTPRCTNCTGSGSYNNSDLLIDGLGETDSLFGPTRIQLALRVYKTSPGATGPSLDVEAEGLLYVNQTSNSNLSNCTVERGDYEVLPDGIGNSTNLVLNRLPLIARNGNHEMRLVLDQANFLTSTQGALYSCPGGNETFSQALHGTVYVESVRYRNGAWINCDSGFGPRQLFLNGDQDLNCN